MQSKKKNIFVSTIAFKAPRRSRCTLLLRKLSDYWANTQTSKIFSTDDYKDFFLENNKHSIIFVCS